MIEILAPAGGEDSALCAINCGANAIYLGLTAFSARSSAENFSFESLKNILCYAHLKGVKVYVAMNTLVKQSEVEEFLNTLITVWNLGVDAIILQDLFLGKYVKSVCPDIVLHLSTQAGVCNEYGALLAKEYGFDRVILARETKFSDIKKIASIIETEVFVQGALCTCFSGQCYLSSFAGGNSGNRGKCKQPCRKRYTFNRKGFEDKAYRISLSDLSLGEDINKLIDAGVVSFKIEGRMRRPEYVAAAVNYYKELFKGNNGDLSALKRTYNRGNYTRGLAFGQDKNFISSAVQGHIGEFIGRIKVISGKYICETLQKFNQGDGFKILRDGKEVGGGNFLSNQKGGFILSSRERLKNGDKVFITTDTELNKKLLNTEIVKSKVKISATFKVGELPVVLINGIKVEGCEILQPATNRPLTKDDVIKCFNKTDVFPFLPDYENIYIVGNIFITASNLNALRRKVYGVLFNVITNRGRVEIHPKFNIPVNINVNNNKKAVIATSFNSIMLDIIVLKPNDYCQNFNEFDNFKGEKFIYLPPYLSGEQINYILPFIDKFDGIYCDGYYGLYLSNKLGKSFFAGTGFNLSNTVSQSQLNCKYVCLSKELTYQEIKPLIANNTFYLTAGNVKVMDLIYCPFEKTCSVCDKLNAYEMTDENGRVFPLRRYNCTQCLFEVYNCADLITENNATGKLYDFTLLNNPNELLKFAESNQLKTKFNSYTKGHGFNPIL